MNHAEAMLAAIKAKDAARVGALLREDPALIRLEGLVRTAAYSGAAEVLQVILAHHPVLDMWEAAIVGDSARILALAGVDRGLVQSADGDGFLPLHLAAHFGRPDAVKTLLGQGADVNALMPSKVSFVPSNTALHAAIAGGPHMDVIRCLIEAGADLNKPDSNGGTPLHAAAFHRSTELVALLLERGVVVNDRNGGGKTPLGVALSRGNSEVAALLRQHGGEE